MKRIITTITLVYAVMAFVQAQEFKIAKSTGRLEIKEVNHVNIEGYSGNEIIFSSRSGKHDKDGRAEGLRAISGSGLEDNTGIGLSVVDKGATIEVQQLKKTDGPEITIKVPKGIVISYSHSSPYGSDVEFKNVEAEIEVSTLHNNVKLDNVTGPLTIKTIHGNIDASLGAGMKSPVSIVSVHGHVDIAFPVATKANLRMGTVYGEIFVDPDFKIDIDRSGNMIKYSDNVTGKLNGGGLDVNLSSTHNNVYLRKK
jgi:hypothetical protein